MKLLRTHLPLLFLALALTGCASPAFRDAWTDAAAAPPSKDLTGPWEGTWSSEKTGHTGALRCLVSPEPGSDGLYDFHYWASWKSILTGEFRVSYPVNRVGEKYVFGGKHDLGKALGGTFTHRGEANATEFDSTYSSAHDKGEFVLKRP